MRAREKQQRPLALVAREWGRIGLVGFGGPPAHIALLRELCVERRRWLSAAEFEDGVAAANLLPGPASTQLAIWTAWRLRGAVGALVGGLAFILPGLIAIVALAAAFLASSPPDWLRGAGAGAGAAVPAVAVAAGALLVPGSVARAASRLRWAVYALLGAVAAATLGPWLVLVLFACGAFELLLRLRLAALVLVWPFAAATAGGLGSLAWTAFKVGGLSYGGGFVIVPLMQGDAVDRFHWMSDGQFLNAVALGQVTPGPVTHTVAAVGYAAHGVGGALLAAAVAFTPSFAFVLIGAPRFGRLVSSRGPRAFLDGAGPAAIGAILGSAIPLAIALSEAWQYALLGFAAVALLVARRRVVETLLAAGAVGAVGVVSGWPLSG
ncbi:MAG: chromate efflux transporter [Thermoleophilaceae bacterium]